MAGAADVEMRAADAETEKKKALLVYKNQQSASDDDEDDEDDEGGRDDNSVDDDEAPAGAGGRRRDPEVEDDDDVDDDDVDDDDVDDETLDEDDGGVRVEKDDDESINAPSDDDLDSTATPRRVDTDDDEDAKSAGDAPAEAEAEAAAAAVTALGKAADGSHSDGDSVSESSRAPSPSPSAKIDEGTSVTLKSGTTTNVNAIIAARRRTGAKKECEACHEPRNGRRALLCANCKCMYHTSCFRKQFSKLVHASGRQWFCPDCEEANKPEEAEAEAPTSSSTPRKGRRDDAPKGRRSAKSTAGGAAAARGKGDADDKHGLASGGGFVSMDLESQRVTEIALRGGKKINTLILERTEEMLQLTKSLSAEIENVMGPTWHNADANGVHSSVAPNSPPPPPFMLVPSHSSSASSPVETEIDPAASSANGTGDVSEHEVLIRRAHTGLESLKHLLEQLQVSGIQFEVDLIKEIKMPPVRDDHKPSSSAAARKSQAASRANAGATKAKNGASRLYSSKQIQKLEEWYQRSSRPESSEIQAMYRIINCPEYADPELQPDGISVKQIRIWFDNRRAKERLDYMRLKMKDISTADMDAESVKRMKAAYIDEAKEVLEARVSRLRENGKGTGQKIVDEADMLLLGSADRSLPTQKATKSSPAGKGQAHGSASGEAAPAKMATNPKKRIRIDYVASVRKAVKDARESGKSEEEIKALRTSAIERARERLHVPFKNARTGPSKPLGKEEVTHIKLKMLKLLEEDAPADELTDVIELLLSLIIPRDVLIDSGFSRQLELVLKAHKDNKELVRQTTKLMDEFKSIVEQTEATPAGSGEASAAATASTKKKKGPGKNTSLLVGEDAQSLPGTPGISPNSPAASPESRRPRVKFSLEQLVKLEKYFHKEDTPSKKRLDKIAMKLNGIATQDPNSDEAQKSIDYKQIRCWFYKRRSTNQPPQALTAADIHDLSQASSSSDTESDTNEGSPSKARGKGTAASKRKAPSGDAKPAVKRSKKDSSAGGDARGGKKEAKAKEASPVQAASTGKQHPGRIFNVKQLATIIEEYEKNPRPSVARLEELQKVLNQDDHADENVQSALGVTKRQIKTWFSNRRAKERLDLIKMKIKESQGAKAAGEDGSGGSETEDDENETPKKRPASAGKSAPSAETASRESSDAEGRQDGAPLRKRIIVRDDDDDDDDDEDEEDEDVDMDGDEEGAEEAA